MSKKKLVIPLALGLVTFGASFGIFHSINKSRELAATSKPAASQATSQSAEKPEVAENGVVSPKEKQLDELAKELALRIADYKRRDAKLTEREKRIDLAEDMLKKEAKDLEALRVELASPIAGFKKAQDDLQASRVIIAKQEATNLKKAATVFESMETASSSKIITEMINNKQEEDAVRILHFMSARSVAKLMAEMPDKSMVAKLSEKLKKVQDPS